MGGETHNWESDMGVMSHENIAVRISGGNWQKLEFTNDPDLISHYGGRFFTFYKNGSGDAYPNGSYVMEFSDHHWTGDPDACQ